MRSGTSVDSECGRQSRTVVSDEAETSAELSCAKTISLIQWLWACTCVLKPVGLGFWLESESSVGANEEGRGKSRSHEQMTPSRPAEYLERGRHIRIRAPHVLEEPYFPADCSRRQ